MRVTLLVLIVGICLCEATLERKKKAAPNTLEKRGSSSMLCRLAIPLFTCHNRDCVLRSWYCDGEPDCKDGSDESDCEDNVCDPRHRISCGDGTCRPLSYRCDGNKDCPSGADEQGCPASRDFLCKDGTLVKNGKEGICDHYYDCDDGSDEEDCENYSCNALQMSCDNASCRPIYYMCDGEIDCLGGEDENGCDY